MPGVVHRFADSIGSVRNNFLEIKRIKTGYCDRDA